MSNNKMEIITKCAGRKWNGYNNNVKGLVYLLAAASAPSVGLVLEVMVL